MGSYPSQRKILSQTGFPRPLTHPVEKYHRIGPSKLGGQGMFATRFIAAGSLILSERPLAMQPIWMTGVLSMQSDTTHLTYSDRVRAILFETEKHAEEVFSRCARRPLT